MSRSSVRPLLLFRTVVLLLAVLASVAFSQTVVLRAGLLHLIIAPGDPNKVAPVYNESYELHFYNAAGAKKDSSILRMWSAKDNPRKYRASGDTFTTPFDASTPDIKWYDPSTKLPVYGAAGFRYFNVTSLDSGLVKFHIADATDPFYSILYYFPRFTFTVDAASSVATSATSIRKETGEFVRITVKAYKPTSSTDVQWSTLDTGLTSADKRQQLIPIRTGNDTNLVFYPADASGNRLDTEIDSILMTKGVADFYVGSAKPINGTSLKFNFTMWSQQLSTFKPNMVGTFPGKIYFSYGDAPSMDSASLYDADGDGVGDSVAAWFNSALDVKPTNPLMSWPTNGDMKPASTNGGSLTWSTGTKLIGWEVDEIAIPNGTTGAGDFGVTVTGKSGNQVQTQAPLKDLVGPVIQSVTLRPGRLLPDGKTRDPDTLVTRFNKEIDSSFTEGDAFMVNGELVYVTGKPVGDRTWEFVLDDAGSLITGSGDSLTIAVDGGIVAADGNKPSENNRPAIIREAGTLPGFAEDGNGFFDSDGDGSLDSIRVEFLEPLSQDLIDSLVFNFFWKDTLGNPYRIPLGADDYTWDPKNPKVITWKFNPDSMGIMPFLTSITGEEYGYGNVENHYEENGEPQTDLVGITMKDRMAPVLVSAKLTPESSSEKKGDAYKLRFSEPVDQDALMNQDFLSFLMTGDSKSPTGGSIVEWNDSGTVLSISVGKGDPLRQRPNPGDSLRILAIAEGIADTNGNAMLLDGPRVMLQGNARVLTDDRYGAGVKYRADIGKDAPKDKNGNPKPISVSYWDDGTELSDLPGGSLGILLDVGPSTVGDVDDLLGTMELDKDKIGLNWTLDVYNNFGNFVASSKGEIACSDSESTGFNGDCFKNRKQVYISWNLLAENGRKVGFGVYIAKLYVRVWGDKSKKIEKVYRWGVGPCGSNTKILCRD